MFKSFYFSSSLKKNKVNLISNKVKLYIDKK